MFFVYLLFKNKTQGGNYKFCAKLNNNHWI